MTQLTVGSCCTMGQQRDLTRQHGGMEHLGLRGQCCWNSQPLHMPPAPVPTWHNGPVLPAHPRGVWHAHHLFTLHLADDLWLDGKPACPGQRHKHPLLHCRDSGTCSPLPWPQHVPPLCSSLLPPFPVPTSLLLSPWLLFCTQDAWERLRAVPREVSLGYEEFPYREGGQTLQQASWRGGQCPKPDSV